MARMAPEMHMQETHTPMTSIIMVVELLPELLDIIE
jgi:hypothetical protein